MSANFTPNQNDYKNLTPFKSWLLLQINTWGQTNFPFVESDFDELTNYGMMLKMMGALNDVISNMNDVEQDMTNLFNAFTELQSYVNNYFDNLDVQDEINQKLDEMAQDGSLTNLIRNYIDPIINDQNSAIANLQTLVESTTSGSPLVASSTSEMTDTSRVYVNTTDGKWYYYDGDSWEIGGTYQSTGISENSVGVSNFTKNTKDIVYSRIPSYTLVDNKYRNGNTIASNNAYTYTSAIALYKGETIRFNASGESTSITLLSLVDDENANIRKIIQSSDSLMKDCLFTAPYDLYVSICYKKSNGLTDLVIYKSVETQLKEIQHQDIFNNFTKSYINKNGQIESHNSYILTDYVEIAPNTKYIIKNLNFEFTDAVGYCLYDKNQNRISGANYVQNTTDYIINLTPSNAKYIRFCFPFLNSGTWWKVYLESFETLYDVVNDLKNEIKTSQIDIIKRTIGIAKNVVCCGDSLTVGISDTASETYYTNPYNYPYFLKKLMNVDNISKIAHGGYTSTQWWNEYQNNITATNSLYIVWLCTNDTFTDSVSTDCNGNDYTQFADTETGNLGKIIGKILSLSGNKVILLNQFTNTSTKTINNKVISDLATKFSCLLVDISNVDLTNTIYHTSYTGYIANTHLNNKGYNYLANIINNKLNEYLATEQFEFQE